MRKVFSLSAVLIAMFASASAWSGVDYLVSPLGGVRGQLGNDGSVAYMSLDECLDEPCKDLILNGAVINDFVPMAGANPNLGVSHYRLNNVGDVLWTHHRSYMTPAGLPAVDVYVNSTLVDTVLGPSPSEYDQLEFGVDLVAFDDTGRGIWRSMAEEQGDNEIGTEEEFWFLDGAPLGGVRGQLGNDGSVAYMSLDECLDEPCKDLILNGAVINDFVPMAGANPNLGVSHYRLNNAGDVLWTNHRSYMTPEGLPAVDVYVNSTLVDTVLGPSPSEYDQLEFGVSLGAFDDTGRGIWRSMAEEQGDNEIGTEEEFWFLDGAPLGGVRGLLGNDGSVAYMSLDECLDEPCKDLILNGAVINDFVPMAGANPNLGVSHYRLNNVGDVLWTHGRSYMTPAGLPAIDVYVNSTLVDTVLGPSPSEYDLLDFNVGLGAFDDTGRGIWHSMAEDHGDNPIGPEEEFWFLAAPSGPASVPEPATAVLLALGLVGMGVRMRRREYLPDSDIPAAPLLACSILP